MHSTETPALPLTSEPLGGLASATSASGLIAQPVRIPTREALEEALEEAQTEIRDLRRDRDELTARLEWALDELRAVREPARRSAPEPRAATPTPQADDELDRDFAALAPGASLLPQSSSGSSSRAALAPSGALPAVPAVSVVSVVPAVIIQEQPESSATRATSSPLRTSARPRVTKDLSRVVVSTRPPAITESSPPSGSERRTIERHACEFDVEFLGETHFTTGLSQDLSEGGVFVATYQTLPIGTPVSLAFDLPSGHRVQARGEVRWARGELPNAHPGLGIAFTELSPEALERIVEYCGSSPAHYYEF